MCSPPSTHGWLWRAGYVRAAAGMEAGGARGGKGGGGSRGGGPPMFGDLVSAHAAKQAATRNRAEELAQRASARAADVVDAAIDVTNNRVSQLFAAQKSGVEGSVKMTKNSAASLKANVAKLVATIDAFDCALKECGDLLTWTEHIAAEINDVANVVQATAASP